MEFAVRFGLTHPVLAFRVAIGRITEEQAFARMLEGQLRGLVRRYAAAGSTVASLLRASPAELQQELGRLLGRPWIRPPMALNPWHALLYLATRQLRPSVVVETGVWYGWSSAAILQAIHENGTGRLVSIDLPPAAHRTEVQAGAEVRIGLHSPSDSVGSSVPERLRDRWQLCLGDSLELLPRLLETDRPISMFVHDSLHTYEHMTREYNLGFEALQEGGLLVSDDIGLNTAWAEFCTGHGLAPVRFSKAEYGSGMFGFAQKTGPAPPGQGKG